MRNIWTVFKTDLRTLSKCFFACVVVAAIALLPSLYAWLNIYSNWDPYGNTGGISIAVASLDEGYTDEDGVYENKGDNVVDDLREAASINWVIVDTEEEAKSGVESGDYYAAVVIDRDFSRNMFRMLTDWTGKPAITYYENAKKNAVATKITDTAVGTLKRSISENYLEVVIGSVMEQSNLLAADLTADDPEAAVRGVLYQAQDLLHACGDMMDAFRAAEGSGGISKADAKALEDAVASVNKNLPDGAKLKQTVAEIQLHVNAALAKAERALEKIENAVSSAPEWKTTQQQLLDAAKVMEETADALNQWADGVEPSAPLAAKEVRQLASQCSALAAKLRTAADSPDIGRSGGGLRRAGGRYPGRGGAAARNGGVPAEAAGRGDGGGSRHREGRRHSRHGRPGSEGRGGQRDGRAGRDGGAAAPRHKADDLLSGKRH